MQRYGDPSIAHLQFMSATIRGPSRSQPLQDLDLPWKITGRSSIVVYGTSDATRISFN